MRGWYGSWLIVLAGMSSTGCDDYAGEDADATDPRLQRKLGLSTCGAWRCGYNAAEINGRSLQTLHLQGLANADGVRIVGFVPPPLRFGYSLAVEGDALVAKRPGSTLAGAQLIGATILVRVQTDLVLPVVIAGYDAVPSWADGGGTIAAYTLLYLDPDTLVTRSVCTGTPLSCGIEMSSSTRSGCSSLHATSRLRPSPTAPTTSTRSASSWRRPSRNSEWSSASNTRGLLMTHRGSGGGFPLLGINPGARDPPRNGVLSGSWCEIAWVRCLTGPRPAWPRPDRVFHA